MNQIPLTTIVGLPVSVRLRNSRRQDILTLTKKRQRGPPFFCYLIVDGNGQGKHTYVGMTNNLQRRIRQHNKTLVGGAKYTSRFSLWDYRVVVGPFDTKSAALRAEWWWKHFSRRSRNTRLRALAVAFTREKISKHAEIIAVCDAGHEI